VSFLRDFIAQFYAAARSETQRWPIKESARIELWHRLHEAFIDAMRECGEDVTALEATHRAQREKFKTDLAAGHIPDHWSDPYVPEQHGRIWSRDLKRYLSKQEIIEKFGESAVVSPIDHVLDEAGVAPASWENAASQGFSANTEVAEIVKSFGE
jgi:hypothetical protein